MAQGNTPPGGGKKQRIEGLSVRTKRQITPENRVYNYLKNAGEGVTLKHVRDVSQGQQNLEKAKAQLKDRQADRLSRESMVKYDRLSREGVAALERALRKEIARYNRLSTEAIASNLNKTNQVMNTDRIASAERIASNNRLSTEAIASNLNQTNKDMNTDRIIFDNATRLTIARNSDGTKLITNNADNATRLTIARNSDGTKLTIARNTDGTKVNIARADNATKLTIARNTDITKMALANNTDITKLTIAKNNLDFKREMIKEYKDMMRKQMWVTLATSLLEGVNHTSQNVTSTAAQAAREMTRI